MRKHGKNEQILNFKEATVINARSYDRENNCIFVKIKIKIKNLRQVDFFMHSKPTCLTQPMCARVVYVFQ